MNKWHAQKAFYLVAFCLIVNYWMLVFDHLSEASVERLIIFLIGVFLGYDYIKDKGVSNGKSGDS